MSFATCSQSPFPQFYPAHVGVHVAVVVAVFYPVGARPPPRPAARAVHIRRASAGATTAAVLSIRSRESSRRYPPRASPPLRSQSSSPLSVPARIGAPAPAPAPEQQLWLSTGAREVSLRVVFVFVSLLCVVCVSRRHRPRDASAGDRPQTHTPNPQRRERPGGGGRRLRVGRPPLLRFGVMSRVFARTAPTTQPSPSPCACPLVMWPLSRRRASRVLFRVPPPPHRPVAAAGVPRRLSSFRSFVCRVGIGRSSPPQYTPTALFPRALRTIRAPLLTRPRVARSA